MEYSEYIVIESPNSRASGSIHHVMSKGCHFIPSKTERRKQETEWRQTESQQIQIPVPVPVRTLEMARTKQTARKATGPKSPRKPLRHGRIYYNMDDPPCNYFPLLPTEILTAILIDNLGEYLLTGLRTGVLLTLLLVDKLFLRTVKRLRPRMAQAQAPYTDDLFRLLLADKLFPSIARRLRKSVALAQVAHCCGKIM